MPFVQNGGWLLVSSSQDQQISTRSRRSTRLVIIAQERARVQHIGTNDKQWRNIHSHSFPREPVPVPVHSSSTAESVQQAARLGQSGAERFEGAFSPAVV